MNISLFCHNIASNLDYCYFLWQSLLATCQIAGTRCSCCQCFCACCYCPDCTCQCHLAVKRMGLAPSVTPINSVATMLSSTHDTSVVSVFFLQIFWWWCMNLSHIHYKSQHIFHKYDLFHHLSICKHNIFITIDVVSFFSGFGAVYLPISFRQFANFLSIFPKSKT